jgi:hypothetical protein
MQAQVTLPYRFNRSAVVVAFLVNRLRYLQAHYSGAMAKF